MLSQTLQAIEIGHGGLAVDDGASVFVFHPEPALLDRLLHSVAVRDLDAAGGGLDLIAGRRVHVAVDIGGACLAGAVARAAVAVTVPAVPAAVAASVSAVSAAIAVTAISAAAPAIAAAVTTTTAAAITAAVPAAVSTTIAAAVSAAIAGIGLGHNDTIEGETERRDNKRQRSQRLQDQPAAPAR